MNNIGSLQRIWRLVIGFSLLTWAIAGGPGWAYLGLYWLFGGSIGFSLRKALKDPSLN